MTYEKRLEMATEAYAVSAGVWAASEANAGRLAVAAGYAVLFVLVMWARFGVRP